MMHPAQSSFIFQRARAGSHGTLEAMPSVPMLVIRCTSTGSLRELAGKRERTISIVLPLGRSIENGPVRQPGKLGTEALLPAELDGMQLDYSRRREDGAVG